MVIEMPVLDNALLGCALAFTPLMVALTFGEPVMRLVARAAQLVPRGAAPLLTDIGLDTLRQDPGPSAAVLQGLFFGRIAPPSRARESAPALVIGHPRDPVHPFRDADMLVARAAQRPAARGQLDPRAAHRAAAADRRDRRLRRRVLAARRRGGASRTRRVA